MTKIIVAFSKMEEAKNIKSVLARNGFDVIAAGTSGAYTISAADEIDSGIIICGYKLADMLFMELKDCLPRGFRILLVASERYWMECEDKDVVFLPTPVKVHSLLETLQMMIETSRKQHQSKSISMRSKEEQEIILKAKRLLMEKNAMSEEDAHRYIQKCSMDSGNSLVETAHMVISFYG